MSSKYPNIGAHVSVAGGLKNGVEKAVLIGAECIQIFGSSPRQWKVRMPTPKEVEEYVLAQKKHRVHPVYLHASYLVNLASADKKIYANSVESLAGHLKIAKAIRAEGLIFHIGAHKKGNREGAVLRAVEGIKEVLKRVPGTSWLVMENSATNAKLGATVEEIGLLFNKVNSKRLRVCMDTAHAYAAGILEFTEEGVRDWCEKMDKAFGLENMSVLHLNDAATTFGSGVDRHENIGKGHIGKQGMKVLIQEKRLQDKAWILEVPGFKEEGPDRKNIDILKSYFR